MSKNKSEIDSDFNSMELAFCYEYLANKFNGKKAAIAAGYSEKTAEVKASQLLSIVKVKNKIKELTEKHLTKLSYTAEDILKELALLGFSNMNNHISFDGKNPVLKSFDNMGEATACIKEFDIDELVKLPYLLSAVPCQFQTCQKRNIQDSQRNP